MTLHLSPFARWVGGQPNGAFLGVDCVCRIFGWMRIDAAPTGI